jgi:hypothetical protein
MLISPVNRRCFHGTFNIPEVSVFSYELTMTMEYKQRYQFKNINIGHCPFRTLMRIQVSPVQNISLHCVPKMCELQRSVQAGYYHINQICLK